MTVAQALDILGRLETVAIDSTALMGWIPLCNPLLTSDNAPFLAALVLDARSAGKELIRVTQRGRTQLWEPAQSSNFWNP